MRGPWLHRIDAVPRIGRTVDFMAYGVRLRGTVVPATEPEQKRFAGIGSEVVYQSSNRRYVGEEVTHWRYL